MKAFGSIQCFLLVKQYRCQSVVFYSASSALGFRSFWLPSSVGKYISYRSYFLQNKANFNVVFSALQWRHLPIPFDGGPRVRTVYFYLLYYVWIWHGPPLLCSVFRCFLGEYDKSNYSERINVCCITKHICLS